MADEQSYGEKLVRVAFNPSGDQVVIDIKQFTADLIDLVEKNKAKDPRLAALAITSFEAGCLWGVKLVTANDSKT